MFVVVSHCTRFIVILNFEISMMCTLYEQFQNVKEDQTNRRLIEKESVYEAVRRAQTENSAHSKRSRWQLRSGASKSETMAKIIENESVLLNLLRTLEGDSER